MSVTGHCASFVINVEVVTVFLFSLKHSKLLKVLTANGWLICSIGTVPLAVTHLIQINAQLVRGALPLAGWTAEWRRGAILFITHVQAVVVTIALPACRDTQLVVTLEIVGFASDGWASVVFIWSIFTVGMAVTLPAPWYAEPITLALEFVIMTHTWTPSSWKG